MKKIVFCCIVVLFCFSCEELGLSEGEVAQGLKAALTQGCEFASGSASKEDGFLLNKAISIALPPEALTVKIDELNHLNSLLPSFLQQPAIPRLGNDVNPNLVEYIIGKAINGLMTLIGQEEQKIRVNPLGQASDIIRKVFSKQ